MCRDIVAAYGTFVCIVQWTDMNRFPVAVVACVSINDSINDSMEKLAEPV
jgi:hypothetical protein